MLLTSHHHHDRPRQFVVGGYTGGSSEGRGRGEKKVEQGASSDDTGVFILDAAEMHWGRPKVVGTGPCPR